jgi:hypothetical protein
MPDHVSFRQHTNEKYAHGNTLHQMSDKEKSDSSKDFPMFSNSKFIPAASSLLNHKQSTEASRTLTHGSIQKSTPMSTKTARTDAANLSARTPSAQRSRPGRGRVASAVAAAAAFADAPTVPAPLRAASRTIAVEQHPTSSPPTPTPQSLTGAS